MTAPPQSELQVKSIVLPNPVASAESTDLPEPSPGVATEEPAGDSDRPSLPEYIDAVHSLGRQLSEAAQQFGAAALLFRAGQLTLDQFQAAFSDFAPQIRDLIQQISQLSPPREAEALHQKLVTGMGKCNQAVDLMEDWFASPNSDTKEAATLLVTDCVEEVTGVE